MTWNFSTVLPGTLNNPFFKGWKSFFSPIFYVMIGSHPTDSYPFWFMDVSGSRYIWFPLDLFFFLFGAPSSHPAIKWRCKCKVSLPILGGQISLIHFWRDQTWCCKNVAGHFEGPIIVPCLGWNYNDPCFLFIKRRSRFGWDFHKKQQTGKKKVHAVLNKRDGCF